MSRTEALDRATQEVRTALGALVDRALLAQAERRAHPHREALRARYMADHTTWPWRGMWRRRCRRFTAQAFASDTLANACSGADLADALGLVHP